MTIEDEEEVDDLEEPEAEPEEPTPKQKKRSKPRRQSGTAAAFHKRTSIRALPERTSSKHRVERKRATGGGVTTDFFQGSKVKTTDNIEKASHLNSGSALRAIRGAPKNRGVDRSASSGGPNITKSSKSGVTRKVPARSASGPLKAFRKERGAAADTPLLTGADLLNLRKAQKEEWDADSIQSDMESTYTIDSINLRKNQFNKDDDYKEKDEIEAIEVDSIGSFGTIDSIMLQKLHMEEKRGNRDEMERDDSVSTLNTADPETALGELDSIQVEMELDQEEHIFEVKD